MSRMWHTQALRDLTPFTDWSSVIITNTWSICCIFILKKKKNYLIWIHCTNYWGAFLGIILDDIIHCRKIGHKTMRLSPITCISSPFFFTLCIAHTVAGTVNGDYSNCFARHCWIAPWVVYLKTPEFLLAIGTGRLDTFE